MCVGKVAVVTGANKGLGFAIVKQLCQKEYGVVILTSRDEARGLNACKKLNNMGLKPHFKRLDITDQSSVIEFCDYIKEEHGKIDLLINNAGILYQKDASEPPTLIAKQTLLVNLVSLIILTERLIPFIKDNGKIVNISSSSGHLSRIPSQDIRRRLQSEDSVDGLKKLMEEYLLEVEGGKLNEWGDSAYVVSKVGVNAYTFILSRKLASRGIQVNCVHPGYVKSDMTGGSGSVTPDQGAEHPLRLALQDFGSGLYLWHDGTIVPWDGPDPREWIDRKK